MPGMNGDEACWRLKKIKPKVKIVLASGYVRFYSEEYLVAVDLMRFQINHLL